MTRHVSRLAFALLLCALSGASAQEPDAPPLPDTFGETIEVNIINVLATVTDKDGVPVHGLTKDDFEILEDGQPMPITNFYAVRRDQVVESATAQIADRGRGGPPVTPPSIAPTETRHIVLFVDNGQIAKRNRKQVFQGIRDFVRENMTTYDQIMVVALNKDYEVVQEFTNSPADVVMAIDRLERVPAEGTRRENARIQLLRTLESTDLAPSTATGPGGIGAPSGMTRGAKVESASRGLMVQIEFLARDEYNQAQKTLAGLNYLISSMAGLPGRKAIIYLSDGVPMRPGETLYHAHYNYFSNASEVYGFDQPMMSPELVATQFDLTRAFEALAAHAQAKNVMFSAIDAAGKHDSVNISAQRRLRDMDTLAVTEYQPAWTNRLDTLRTQNLQDPIRLVAEETGGTVLINTRDYSGFFDDLRDRLDNYYSLGFEAPHPKGGQQHKLEVKVKIPGLKVHHRRAYRDQTWIEELSAKAVTELLLGVGDNPLKVEVTPGAATPREDEKLLLPLQIVVPIGNLEFAASGEERLGNASIVVIVKDLDGNTSAPFTMPLTIRMPESDYSGASERLAEAVVNLVVSPGRQIIGVGLRDEIGGVMSTTTLDLEITKNNA